MFSDANEQEKGSLHERWLSQIEFRSSRLYHPRGAALVLGRSMDWNFVAFHFRVDFQVGLRVKPRHVNLRLDATNAASIR